MSRVEKFKRFVKECVRVLKVTRKPDRTEFVTTLKVTGMGIAAIGLIGLVLAMVNQMLF